VAFDGFSCMFLFYYGRKLVYDPFTKKPNGLGAAIHRSDLSPLPQLKDLKMLKGFRAMEREEKLLWVFVNGDRTVSTVDIKSFGKQDLA